MGVADNRTYKNEYLFNEKHNSVFVDPLSTAEDNPSINIDPKINSTIKENPYKANVEIEGKEVVLQPDLSALFNAVGKRHSKGGMDVLLKPDSFIFSAFNGLDLSPKDHKLYELKEGGKYAGNTPADVLKRNVDIKHYNSLVNIMNDSNKDDLAKKSAALMLEKYINTIGNIAFIQENKKGLPNGVPSFSANTAPVYDNQLKQSIEENKQYAKAGGKVNNPYLPKAQWGGMKQPASAAKSWRDIQSDWSMPSSNKQVQIPTVSLNAPDGTSGMDGLNSTANVPVSLFTPTAGEEIDPRIKPYYDKAVADAQAGKKQSQSYQDFQYVFHKFYPDKAKEILSRYPTTNYGKANNYGKDNILSNTDALWGPRTAEYMATVGKMPQDRLKINIKSPGTAEWPSDPAPAPKPPNINEQQQGMKTASWQFTPWQKLSQLYNWGQYANVQRYMPYRSKYTATYASPSLVNPEQAVGDAKAMAYQQAQSANSLNPIMRNAQAASAYGQAINQIPGIRTQYDNQNAQINNQFREFNTQVKNNESMVNMQNDQSYYQQAIEGRKNYDNMKQYTANNAMNNMLGDVQTNQKLAYNLLTQNNPAYGFDWKSGNFYRNPKNLLDVQSDPKSEYLQEYLGKQLADWDKMGSKERNELLKIMVAKGFTFPQQNTASGYDNLFKKMGGKINKGKNPFKYK